MRWFLAAAVVGFLVAQGCSSTPKCDAKSCSTGCCDPGGSCLAGTVSSQCGHGGQACVACSLAQTCELGTCANVNRGGDGGSDGGGSDGGNAADAGNATDAGNVTLDNIGHELFGAVCAYYVRCGLIASYQACTSILFGRLDEPSLLYAQKQAVRHGRAVFDEAGTAACFDALTTTGPCISVAALCPNLQNQFLIGQVPNGGSCYISEECVPSDYCTTDTTSTCPGACTPRSGVGGSVSRASQCQQGLYDYSGTGTCAARVPDLGSCAPPDGGGTVTQTCVVGDFCDLPGDVCLSLRDAGQDCSGQAGVTCDVSFTCNGSTCQPYAPAGTVCGSSAAPTVVTCQQDLVCLPTVIDGGNSLCRVASASNACLADIDCGPTAYCTGASATAFGTCISLGGLNAACTGSNQCTPGLYCNAGGQCAAQSELWGPCESTGNGCFPAWNCTLDGGNYQCLFGRACADLAP